MSISNTSTATKVAVMVVGLAMLASLVVAMPARAQTVADLTAQINSLLATIASLQAQLAALQGGGGGAGACTFTRDLTLNVSGDDVKCLQTYLMGTGHFTFSGGATGFFGPITKAAVAAWQAANGVSPAAGYFGPISRAKYSSIAGAGGGGGTGTTPPPAAAGTGLSVSAGTQPANSLAPDSAARVPFTRFVVTAGNDGDVTMNSVVVQRTGLAADASFAGVVLLDDQGNQIGIAKTFNSNHQATVGEPVTIPRGTSRTFTIAGNMAADNSSRDGQVASLSVVQVNTSATVSGSLPIVGASHTINASLAIGTVTLNRGVDDPNVNLTKEIGTTNHIFASIRFTAGSAEDVRLRSIRWNQTGSASKTDLNNVVVTVGGVSYPTTVSADGKYYSANFGAGVVVQKGFQTEISIKGDIIGGSNRTVFMDIDKDTDVYATGETYGYGIIPSAGSTATADDNTSQFTTGTPFYDASKLTISAGSVNSFSRASEVPAQNIAINVPNQPLGGFVLDLKGEPISVQQTIFYLLATGNEVNDITNVTLVDGNGAVVAGPVDGVKIAGQGGKVTFTDTITYPTGRTVLTLRGQLNTDFVNGDTIQASSTPSTDWSTIKGQTTGDSISLSSLAAVVSGNTMTVKAATTTVTVASTPASQNVVAGVSGFTFANYQFDATESGEDVRVSSIQFRYTTVGGSDPTNCFVYDGATRLNDTAVNPSGTGPDTYTFSTHLVIPKGTIKTVSLKCDIPGSATAGNQIIFGINNSDTMEGVGLGSGQTIILTHGTSNSGTMTISGGGALAVELDSSSPSYTLASAGSTDVTLGVLKVRATNEDVVLEQIGLQMSNQAASSTPSDLQKVTLWDGTTKVGEAVFTGSTRIATSSLTGTFTIPKDGEKLLTIKGDLSAHGVGQAGTPGALIEVDYDGDRLAATNGTGSSSGTSVQSTSGSDTDVAGVRVFRSYPTFAKVALPSYTLANGERSLFRFRVTADSKGPIGIYKFTVRIATTTAKVDSLNIYAYTDSGFSTPVSGLSSDGGMLSTALDLETVWASASTDLNIYARNTSAASTTVQIPAGGTRYFDVRATVSNSAAGASVSTQIQGDAAYPYLQGLMSSTTANTNTSRLETVGSTSRDDDFLWSPNSTTTSDLDSDDWTNGFGVVGLPSSNMTAEVLSQ